MSFGLRRFTKRLKSIRFGKGRSALARPLQILRMASTFISRGFTPLEFYLYGFYQKGKSARGYVPNRWIEREFRAKLNPMPYAGLVKNKLLFFHFYSRRNLPVPRVLGLFHPEFGTTREDTYLRSLYDLEKLLKEAECRYLVAKPPCSLGGKGMMLLERAAPDELRNLETSEIFNIEGFFDRLRSDITNRQPREDSCTGYLLQEYVKCHPSMNPLGGRALNTVRIATLKDARGAVHLDFAMVRIARPDAVTDNLHRGGVVAGIELSTGRINDVTYGYETDEGPWVERKPKDVGSLFPDRKVPQWGRMVETVIKFHAVLEGVRSIGWDVALSEHGPVVIEGNDNWDMVIAQIIDGPYLTPERSKLLKELDIRIP